MILLLKSWEWVIFNGYVHHAHSRVHLYRNWQYLKRIPWGLGIPVKALCAGALISKIWFFSLVDKVSLLKAWHGLECLRVCTSTKWYGSVKTSLSHRSRSKYTALGPCIHHFDSKCNTFMLIGFILWVPVVFPWSA